MTFSQLEYVMATHRLGTISAAADKLHVSRPAVMKAISNLEAELGIRIFTKNREGAQITDQGRAVLEIAEEILALKTDLLTLSSSEGTRQLFIESYPEDTIHLFSSAIDSFKDTLNIQVHFEVSSISAVLKHLEGKKIDFAVFSLAPAVRSTLSQDIKVEILRTVPLCLIVHKSHPLSQREFVCPEDLSGLTFALLRDQMIIDNLQLILKPLKFENVILYSNNQLLLLEYTRRKKAVSFANLDVFQSFNETQRNELSAIPIVVNGTPFTLEYLVAYCKRHLSMVEKRFLQALKDSIRDQAPGLS